MFTKKEYIYAVYKEKSFSKAAQKLYISQPALSLIVSRVEKDLGTPIFDRSINPIGLTSFGEKYVNEIQKINQIEKELQDYISDINNSNTGSFIIGCNNLYLAYVLPKFLMLFSQKYPGINLSLIEASTQELQQKLRNNELDLTLDNKEIDSPLFIKKYFGTEHLILAVPTNLDSGLDLERYRLSYLDIKQNKHLKNQQNVVPLKQFHDKPFIIMTPGNDTRDRTDQLFAKYEFTPSKTLEFNQLSTVFNIAISGAGCCIVSDTLIQHQYAQIENVSFYRLPLPLSIRKTYFQFNKNKYISKALHDFMEICIQNK